MAERKKTTASASVPAEAAARPARKPRARVRKIQPSEVAERAYLMSLSEPGASPEENWLRAEQELLAS